MLKNFLIILALLSRLHCSSRIVNSISIHLNNFCKLAENEVNCAKRNASHLHQCGSGLCATNVTECEQFLFVDIVIKKKKTEFLMPLNPTFRNNEKLLKEYFRTFQSKIKNCPNRQHEWQQSDVCIRGRNCFQSVTRRKIIKNKGLKRKNCPCPDDRPYVCGIQRNYCTVNRKVCTAFSYTSINKNSTSRNQLLTIKNCAAII